MKKFVLLLCFTVVINLQNAFAEVPPTKIVTGHADLSIKITRCVADGSTVLIDMVFLNKSERDVKAALATTNCIRTMVYDSEGNIYQCPDMYNPTIFIKIANQPFNMGITHVFLSNVPVKAQLKITGVSTIAEYIARIDFPLWVDDFGLDCSHFAILRNIPITRE